MFRIFLTPGADRGYKKLTRSAARDIREVVFGEFCRNPLSKVLDIKKLKVPYAGFRLRIGDYRILFTLKGKNVTIYSIQHRKDAYR